MDPNDKTGRKKISSLFSMSDVTIFRKNLKCLSRTADKLLHTIDTAAAKKKARKNAGQNPQNPCQCQEGTAQYPGAQHEGLPVTGIDHEHLDLDKYPLVATFSKVKVVSSVHTMRMQETEVLVGPTGIIINNENLQITKSTQQIQMYNEDIDTISSETNHTRKHGGSNQLTPTGSVRRTPLSLQQMSRLKQQSAQYIAVPVKVASGYSKRPCQCGVPLRAECGKMYKHVHECRCEVQDIEIKPSAKWQPPIQKTSEYCSCDTQGHARHEQPRPESYKSYDGSSEFNYGTCESVLHTEHLEYGACDSHGQHWKQRNQQPTSSMSCHCCYCLQRKKGSDSSEKIYPFAQKPRFGRSTRAVSIYSKPSSSSCHSRTPRGKPVCVCPLCGVRHTPHTQSDVGPIRHNKSCVCSVCRCELSLPNLPIQLSQTTTKYSDSCSSDTDSSGHSMECCCRACAPDLSKCDTPKYSPSDTGICSCCTQEPSRSISCTSKPSRRRVSKMSRPHSCASRVRSESSSTSCVCTLCASTKGRSRKDSRKSSTTTCCSSSDSCREVPGLSTKAGPSKAICVCCKCRSEPILPSMVSMVPSHAQGIKSKTSDERSCKPSKMSSQSPRRSKRKTSSHKSETSNETPYALPRRSSRTSKCSKRSSYKSQRIEGWSCPPSRVTSKTASRRSGHCILSYKSTQSSKQRRPGPASYQSSSCKDTSSSSSTSISCHSISRDSSVKCPEQAKMTTTCFCKFRKRPVSDSNFKVTEVSGKFPVRTPQKPLSRESSSCSESLESASIPGTSSGRTEKPLSRQSSNCFESIESGQRPGTPDRISKDSSRKSRSPDRESHKTGHDRKLRTSERKARPENSICICSPPSVKKPPKTKSDDECICELCTCGQGSKESELTGGVDSCDCVVCQCSSAEDEGDLVDRFDSCDCVVCVCSSEEAAAHPANCLCGVCMCDPEVFNQYPDKFTQGGECVRPPSCTSFKQKCPCPDCPKMVSGVGTGLHHVVPSSSSEKSRSCSASTKSLRISHFAGQVDGIRESDTESFDSCIPSLDIGEGGQHVPHYIDTKPNVKICLSSSESNSGGPSSRPYRFSKDELVTTESCSCHECSCISEETSTEGVVTTSTTTSETSTTSCRKKPEESTTETSSSPANSDQPRSSYTISSGENTGDGAQNTCTCNSSAECSCTSCVPSAPLNTDPELSSPTEETSASWSCPSKASDHTSGTDTQSSSVVSGDGPHAGKRDESCTSSTCASETGSDLQQGAESCTCCSCICSTETDLQQQSSSKLGVVVGSGFGEEHHAQALGKEFETGMKVSPGGDTETGKELPVKDDVFYDVCEEQVHDQIGSGDRDSSGCPNNCGCPDCPFLSTLSVRQTPPGVPRNRRDKDLSCADALKQVRRIICARRSSFPCNIQCTCPQPNLGSENQKRLTLPKCYCRSNSVKSFSNELTLPEYYNKSKQFTCSDVELGGVNTSVNSIFGLVFSELKNIKELLNHGLQKMNGRSDPCRNIMPPPCMDMCPPWPAYCMERKQSVPNPMPFSPALIKSCCPNPCIPHPCVSLPPPITISSVDTVGSKSLLINWRTGQYSGIAGYEVYVDGSLKCRSFSPRQNSAVAYGVDLNNKHVVTVSAIIDAYLGSRCFTPIDGSYCYQPGSSPSNGLCNCAEA